MRRVIFIVVLLFHSLCTHAQDPELDKLVDAKRYMDLRTALKNSGITEYNRDIYSAILHNVLGRAGASNQYIEKVFAANEPMSDSLRHTLLETQHSNYVKLFNYRKAYETKKFLMENYRSFIKEENVFDEQQALNIWQAIQDVPPQQVTHNGRVELPITIDPILKLQRIPVHRGGKEYSFIFDTGAGISTTTDSMAGLLGLKIYDEVPVVIKGGITGMGTNVRLGVADKLMVGATEVRNVLFLVFPDKAMTFPTGPSTTVKVDIILGFPVIKELGVLTLFKDRMVITAPGEGKDEEPNMAIEYLKPIIYLDHKGKSLPFTFDTGADETVLTEVFYNDERSLVDAEGKKEKASYGGAGGIKEFNIVVMPLLKFKCLSQEILLRDAHVSTEAIHTGDNVYYGNIGQDVIHQFRSMTINFAASRIEFNN